MDRTTAKFTEYNRYPNKKQRNKKIFQHFWKLSIVIVSSFVLVLANKIYLFYTLQDFKDVKKGQFAELIMYVIPCAIIYIILDYSIHDYWMIGLTQTFYDKINIQIRYRGRKKVIQQLGGLIIQFIIHLPQCQYFMSFMMSCLLIMHIYWTYYIAESFISTSVSDKLARHRYD